MTAYDVMDRVQYSVILLPIEHNGIPAPEWTTMAAGTIAGTGESDAREWCRDALIAALESI
jgi:hypothetical protein